ncbi:hypothetical protein ACLD0U_12740 [Microbacterium sp. 2216-1]|uniref:hypothetical protein n=1 Tax=Microbacterium sp. 2216-1 TaxID=3390053 RepID=UPI003977242E
MHRNRRRIAALRESLALAWQALRSWSTRQILIATASAVAVAIVLGVATVLIPNGLFTREIPPVWWNYPVWLITSAVTGLLIGTYVQPQRSAADVVAPAPDASHEGSGSAASSREERRTGRFAVAGGMLAWFAVGCPVCNKIALIALGYTGALTWFAPAQPLLAAAALILSTVAAVWRLRGQVACPLPAPRAQAVTA